MDLYLAHKSSEARATRSIQTASAACALAPTQRRQRARQENATLDALRLLCSMAEAMDARAAALREQEAGNAAVARRDWAAAHELYSGSLALHATAAAHSNRAAARLALGRAADAVDDARAALALDPTFVRAYVRLSAALRALGDNAAALAAAQEGLALAERVGSLLVQQLREAAAAATGGAAPRFEVATPEARALVRIACAHCGAVQEHRHVCARCRQVYYCNDACQRAGWPAHREACTGMRAAMASAAAEVGLAELPATAHTNALVNWVAENPKQWAALRTVAWHVQHALPREWGGGSGAVLFTVLRGAAGAAMLRVQLMPMALLTRVRGDERVAGDVDVSTQSGGMLASLSRVDVEVGFLVAIEDRSAGGALSLARTRYSSPPEVMRAVAVQAVRDRKLRVHAAQMVAELDLSVFDA